MKPIHLVCIVLALFCCRTVYAQGQSDYLEVIRGVTENWTLLSAKFEQTSPTESFESTRPDEIKVWFGESIDRFRYFHSKEYETPMGLRGRNAWRYQTDEFQFRYMQTSITWPEESGQTNSRKTSLSAYVAKENFVLPTGKALTPVEYFFGLDRYSGMSWYSIGQLEDTRISLADSRLKFDNPKIGIFSFEFGENFVLRKVDITKHNRQLGDSPTDRFDCQLSKLKFREFNGKILIESMLVEERSSLAESSDPASSRTSTRMPRLVAVDSLAEDLPNRLDLPNVFLQEKSKVAVFNDEANSYELRNGLVEKVMESGVSKPPLQFKIFYLAGSTILVVIIMFVIAESIFRLPSR